MNFINAMKGFIGNGKRKYAAVFSVILLSALILELFIFNFKFWNSLFDKPLDVTPSLTGAALSADTISFNSDSAVISFAGTDSVIKYLKFNPGSKHDDTIAEITVTAFDEANASGLSAPSRMVISSVKPSQYIRLHFSGIVSSVSIAVKGMNGRSISTNDIALNVHVPMMFSWMRFLIMLLAGALLYLLRPKSPVYKIMTDLTRPKQRIIAAVFAAIQITAFFVTIHWNTITLSWQNQFYWHNQYNDLADSFVHGKLYISDDATDDLNNMENPYDAGERVAEHIYFRWDTAYYNGKYYCYFGAAPAVLLYLPCKLMLGKDMHNHTALFIFNSAMIIGSILLLWEIIKKRYRNTPLPIFLIIWFMFNLTSLVAYTIYCPSFYLVPTASALMFAVFGLYFWLSSVKTSYEHGDTALSCVRLALGSSFVAVTALCRPQFLLTTVLGVMFFWNYAFKDRLLFSKQSKKQTIAVCLPFVIIGLITMWYNFARFGSPFDFGANYNLTSNDMTHRGFVFGRIGLGLFSYLLQPLSVDAVFPFIHDFYVTTVYQGLTLTEKMMGGVLWLYPLLIIGIYGSFRRSLFEGHREIYKFVYTPVLIALIIVIVDTQMAGLLARYSTDFVWLMALASSITIFELFEKYADTPTQRAVIIFISLCAATAVLSFLSIFAHTENAIVESNPYIYYKFQHMIAFWM